MTDIRLLLQSNLGAGFDFGTLVAYKLGVVPATTMTFGKMRFATSAEAANSTAGTVMDAAQIAAALAVLSTSTALGSALAGLPTTKPATSGLAWLNGNVLQIS